MNLTPSTNSTVRIMIRKQREAAASITLYDTNIDTVVTYIKDLLRPEIDVFAEGILTSVTVVSKAPAGTTRTESKTFSFRGLDPAEVKRIICLAIAESKKVTESKKLTEANS